jgi:hypothetical protein
VKKLVVGGVPLTLSPFFLFVCKTHGTLPISGRHQTEPRPEVPVSSSRSAARAEPSPSISLLVVPPPPVPSSRPSLRGENPAPPLLSYAPRRSTDTRMPGLAAPPPSMAPSTRCQSHPLEPVVEFAFSPALCRCFLHRVWWLGSRFCVRWQNSGHFPARSHRAPPSTAACPLAGHQDRLLQDRRTRTHTLSLSERCTMHLWTRSTAPVHGRARRCSLACRQRRPSDLRRTAWIGPSPWSTEPAAATSHAVHPRCPICDPRLRSSPRPVNHAWSPPLCKKAHVCNTSGV